VFWFGLLLFVSVAAVVIVTTPIVPFVRMRDPHNRNLFNRIGGIWARWVCRCWFRVEVVNPENLPSSSDGEVDPHVYVSNHQSFMDVMSMFYLQRPFKFVSKASVTRIPIIGTAMRRAGHVVFERGDSNTQSQVVRMCLAELKCGTSVFFFPEGTRSKTGCLRRFQGGAAFVAKKARVGMVPVTVLGTGDVMPRGRELRLFPSSLGVKLIVHPAISADEVGMLDEAQLTARTRDLIESALPEELREHQHA
jgi:1-acyl-sn-glycerol-3-phosphate acyltransferase